MRRLLLLALLLACGGEPKPPAPPMVAPPIRAALIVQTPKFTVGQAVKTTAAAYIRSSPWHGNTSSNVLGTAPKGAVGTVLDGPVVDTSRDGDGWSRWQLAMASPLPTGWVADTYLVAATVVPPPTPVVTTVAVTPATVSLLVGATAQLTATARDQNGLVMTGQTFGWTSGSGTIAIVSATGLVTGVAPGGVTITATDAGKIGQAGVTVTAPLPPPPPVVAGIMVLPSAVSIRIGELFQFRDTVLDASGAVLVRSVVWSSGNVAVATVDTNGWATAVSLGSTLVTATIGTIHASGQLSVIARTPRPFNGIYANVQLQNGRLWVLRRDSIGVPPILVIAGDTLYNGFRPRASTLLLIHAPALRQLASDLATRSDTVRFPTENALSADTVFCSALGCWIKTVMPGHAPWISRPPMNSAVLIGLAHALEAAARGDTLFQPSDSLPYVKSFP